MAPAHLAPPSPQTLTELREAVADATGVLRTLTFTYLAVWAYVVIAAGSVTHRQLLVGTTIELPLLGAGVGLENFFWLAPALFLVLYANVLLQLYLLARRVRRFDERVRLLPKDEQVYARNLLTPFPFVEWRAGRETTQVMHAVFALANWALYIVLPLFLLLFVQFKFLPYQDPKITPFHLALVVVALVLVWLVWPRLNQAQGGWWAGVQELWRGSVSRWMLAASPVLSVACVLASMLLWFGQRPSALARLEPYVPGPVASFLDYRWSRIAVRDAILMRREPAPEIVAQFRREAGPGKEEEGERRAYLDEELAEPVSLAGRNLRWAQLAGSKLWRARLDGADLQGVDLGWAHLQGADLFKADLQDADLFEAHLQGASLRNADLQGASLAGAHLQGADLSGAHLQGADLGWAHLQGADLREALIFLIRTARGTDLSRADLRSVKSEPLAPEARVALKAELEQAIPDPATRAIMLERLEPILSDQPPAWEPENLPKDKRRDVLTSEGAPGPVRVLTGGEEALVGPRDDWTYYEALAAELAPLACYLDDGRITRRFMDRFRMDDPGFPDFAQHLKDRCPDLITKLDMDTRQVLTNASAKAADTGQTTVSTP